jgi:hypothetical protein
MSWNVLRRTSLRTLHIARTGAKRIRTAPKVMATFQYRRHALQRHAAPEVAKNGLPSAPRNRD